MEFRLTETEVRVLGSLIEKDITTPEYYPLSLNALLNACNQKSNRDPVMRWTKTRCAERSTVCSSSAWQGPLAALTAV